MKKFLTAFLSLMLLLSFANAQLDIPSMQNEELIQLYAAIMAELFSRSVSAEVPVGQYEVGPNIPPGAYNVIIDEPGTFDISVVAVYRGSSSFPVFLSQLSEDVPEIGRIVLQQGDRLEITSGPAVFRNLAGMTIQFK